MNIVNTKLHGIIDYSIASVLVLPWVVNFNEKSSDTWILASIGAVMLIYCLLTDYEWGQIKLIPMKAHFVMDILLAIVLIAAPWLFNIYNYFYYWPVALGITLLVLVIFSSPEAYRITNRDLDITKP
jgi:hypothetical protein